MKIVVIGGTGPIESKVVTGLQSALDIAVRAALTPAERNLILALPYPVEHHVFWRLLASMELTQERLMDRMGASP